MKRYAKWFDEFDESPDGEWVAYDEAAQAIADLQRQLDEERARLDFVESTAVSFGRVTIIPEYAYTEGLSFREAIDQDKAEVERIKGSDT